MSEHDPRSEETIFSSAPRCAPAERGPYLDEAYAGQPALRQRIEELLKAQPQLGEFMENPADIGTPDAPETFRLTLPPGRGRRLDRRIRDATPFTQDGRHSIAMPTDGQHRFFRLR